MLQFRIRHFTKTIEKHCKKTILNDSTLVVDAMNFFYDLYRQSGLQYVFGCESDRFAAYLRKHLSMFKQANVNCYFIFKGGHSDMEKRLLRQEQLEGYNFIIGKQYNDIVMPIFTKDIYKQVLDEMDFKYTICEFEAKTECIALAQKLKCPVLSFDIYFAFSGQPYIPHYSLAFNDRNNVLIGEVFSLDRFLQTYSLTDERLAVFVALTDTYSFPEDHFLPLFKTLRMPQSFYMRNIRILQWLGRTSRDRAVEQIFKHIDSEGKKAFLEVEKNAYDTIRREETPDVPINYLENGNKIDFLEMDPQWFEKGVALKHIPIPLINISRAGVVVGSWAIADNDAEDAMLFAIDIIKYAYNLLTNFKNNEFTFHSRGESSIIPVNDSVKKPDYEAVNSPFENGWEHLPKGLFEYFLKETIEGFDADKLEILPESTKMLMIALIYFIKKKSEDVSNEVLSLLLCYIALTVLPLGENNIHSDSPKKIFNQFKPDNVIDAEKQKNKSEVHCDEEHKSKSEGQYDENQKSKSEVQYDEKQESKEEQYDLSSIKEEDKQIAREILKEYCVEVNVEAAKKMFNPKWLHPLVEFQHCLEFLNHLNTLCGCPYRPTVFRDTFNGTFVYKALWAMRSEGDGEGFVKRLLQPAPSVLKFLFALYEFANNM